MVIITGLGRSGSDLIASLYHVMGFYMGKFVGDGRSDYEIDQVKQINHSIMAGDFWGDAHVRTTMKGLSNQLKIVKDTRFMVTLGEWIKSGATIDHVILCSRNLDEVLKSSEYSNVGLMAAFNGLSLPRRLELCIIFVQDVMKLCEEHHIPVTRLQYPDMDIEFETVLPLTNIGCTNKDKLERAWERMAHPSEASKIRDKIIVYCEGKGVDIGCGQKKIKPDAVGVDFNEQYNHKDHPKTDSDFKGGFDAFFKMCSEKKREPFDYIFSSHLLEDYDKPADIIKRWIPWVKPGGYIISVLPIEEVYRGVTSNKNEAHKRWWKGSEEFLTHLLEEDVMKGMECVDSSMNSEPVGGYSFYVVLRKKLLHPE